ncbi:MAG: DUF2489 domain-containing protein [Spongiibacter sp.]|nr:DUF2489 domain-containing protein [Spongiibacter sp.]
MMESVWFWLVLAGVIILALAAYAGYLLLALRRQKQAAAAVVQIQQPEAAPASQALDAVESVKVLARCFIDGQVGASEAALRIAVLLDQPQVPAAVVAQGQVFRDVAAALAHIPTHQQWRELSREQRDQFRAEMDSIEENSKARMLEAAQRLGASA